MQNIADIKAQLAANEKGTHELRKMVDQFGLAVVKAYMGHVQDNAEESVRRYIGALKDCEFSYEMDQGTVVCVRIAVDHRRRAARIDFTGTSPQQPTNSMRRVRLPAPRFSMSFAAWSMTRSP